jgi:gallate decarboxylase subunit D
MMDSYQVSVAPQTLYGIELTAVVCSTDYCVTICGGSRYHVGATALGYARAGGDCLPGTSATVSVLCAPGHRDDEVARWAARYLATELGCNVSVTAGVHIDGATVDDIQILLANCKDACKRLLQLINPCTD